jgi:heavy metal sensor kinase
VVVAIGLFVFAGMMWFALERRLVADVDERLQDEIHGLQTLIDSESEANSDSALRDEIVELARELPEHTSIQLRDGAGNVIVSGGDITGIPAGGPSGYRTIGVGRKPFRLLNISIRHGDRILAATVAASLEDVEEIVRDFRNLLFVTIPAILVFSALGGYWMSRRALAPVDDITLAAKSITVQNLSRRLAVPDTCDELQRMSEAWNEVLERLDSAIQKIVKFTADASHELRTPIAVIRTAAELALRTDREPDQYKESLRIIDHEARRITELTESLLTLARMDSGTVEMPLARVDIGQLSNQLIRHLMSMASERGITLQTECDPSRTFAMANEPGIRRLLLILLDNGIKYTRPGGTVLLSVVPVNGRLCITVRDSGEGIGREHLPHIFERFYRVDAARPVNDGAGLGLSIAKTIADVHRTKIEVESTAGRGSSFTFSLLEYR